MFGIGPIELALIAAMLLIVVGAPLFIVSLYVRADRAKRSKRESQPPEL